MSSLAVLAFLFAAAWGQDYQHLSPDVVMSHATVEIVQLVEPPQGVVITWAPDSYGLGLEVLNQRSEVIRLSWDDCAFVDPGGVAGGLAPGSVFRQDVKGAIAPAVIPPGAKIVEALVRESAIHSAGDSESDEPFVGGWSEGAQVSVTLAFDLGVETVFHTQAFSVVPDHALLGLMDESARREKEAAAAAAEQMKRAAASAERRRRLELEYTRKYDKYAGYRNKAWLFGGIGAGAGLTFGVVTPLSLRSDPEYQWSGEDTVTAAILGYVPFAVGVPLAVHFARKAREAKKDVPRKPAGME